MPGFNDSVALGVQTPQPAAVDPMRTLSTFATIQNALNQNRLFQQTFAARQKAGEILAASPPDDPEAGIRALMSDPQTAPFAGEIITNIRGAQKALIDIQGAQQTQAQSALGGFYKSLPSLITNPTQKGWDTLVNQNLATMPKGPARDLAARAMSDVYDGITYGLPQGSDNQSADMRSKLVNNRIMGLLVGNGVSPDSIYGSVLPKQSFQDTGGGIASVLTAPSQQGGQPTVAGSLGKSLTPQLHDVGGIPLQFGGAGSSLAAPQATTLGKPQATAGDASAAASGSPDAVSKLLRIQSLGKANEEMAGTAKDIQTEMSDNAKEIPVALRKIDFMTDALKGFQAGGGAEWRTHLASLFQGAKNAGASFVTDDMINKVGNDSLPDSQVFMAAVKPFVIGQLKEAAQGTGRVMRSEVDTFLSMLSASTDPNAILRIMDLAKYRLQVGNDMADKFVDFKQGIKSGKLAQWDLQDFPTYYNRNFGKKPLPTSNQGGGLNLGPTSSSGVKGAAVKRFRYDKDGNLVPSGAQ